MSGNSEPGPSFEVDPSGEAQEIQEPIGSVESVGKGAMLVIPGEVYQPSPDRAYDKERKIWYQSEDGGPLTITHRAKPISSNE